MIAGDESSWDFGFLESIRDQVTNGRTLSQNQQNHFQQIEGRWSDEALSSRADWNDSWDEEKEQKEQQEQLALQVLFLVGLLHQLIQKIGMEHLGQLNLLWQQEDNF